MPDSLRSRVARTPRDTPARRTLAPRRVPTRPPVSARGVEACRRPSSESRPATRRFASAIVERPRSVGRMTDDLAFLDATAQAELVERGELKPSDLVEAAIARVERVNPQLNAV